MVVLTILTAAMRLRGARMRTRFGRRIFMEGSKIDLVKHGVWSLILGLGLMT